MGKIITVHSFRGGTGKSNISANLGYILYSQNRKVCIFDSDLQSPGLHILLGHTPKKLATLTDYLLKKSKLEDILIDLSSKFNNSLGKLYLAPCDMSYNAIASLLKNGYDIEVYTDIFRETNKFLKADFLIIDTHPGFNEETLISMAVADTLLIVTRMDKQDFAGTAITIEIAKKLGVKNILIVVNLVPQDYDGEYITKEIEKKFECKVAGLMFYDKNIARLGSENLFSIVEPKSKWTQQIIKIAKEL